MAHFCRWPVHPPPPNLSLLSMLVAAEFTDFTIKAADGTCIPVHKNVLSRGCEHLRGLLTGPWKDKEMVG